VNVSQILHQQKISRILLFIIKILHNEQCCNSNAYHHHIQHQKQVSSVYLQTGYVITYADCPILWVSRLQTEMALSTTEAEYIALLQAMQDLILFMTLVEDVLAIYSR